MSVPSAPHVPEACRLRHSASVHYYSAKADKPRMPGADAQALCCAASSTGKPPGRLRTYEAEVHFVLVPNLQRLSANTQEVR